METQRTLPAGERTVADIEMDLAAARARLTENLAELINQVHPKAVAHRTITEARREVRRRFDDPAARKALVIAGVTVAVVVVAVGLLSRKK